MENPTKILIVDDHQIVIDGIKSMLSGHLRYLVFAEALNANAALELIHASPLEIDLVITDISMIGSNGMVLCQKIKSYDSNIKVLILTMHNDVNYVKEALNCEADGYMLKNIGQAEFLVGLDSLMEKGSYFTHEIVPLLYKEVKLRNTLIPLVKLSQRESEILQLILKEYTSKEIAEKLFISKQTVDSHRISIMSKTSSKSVVGLIKYAIENNLHPSD